MGRYPSVIDYKDLRGNRHGMELQQRDIDFITLTARWWTISIDHYLRWNYPEELWKDYVLGRELSPQQAQEYQRAYRGMNDRASKLVRIDGGAPIYRRRMNAGASAYWATTHAAELIGSPWMDYPKGNVSRLTHAWAACDIGRQIESKGVKVYSEREFSYGYDVHSNPVLGGVFENRTPGSKAPIGKGYRPDLAIAGQGGEQYIMVEVERTVRKPPSYFRPKLNSYFANPRVGAVWYIVEHESTARRIAQLYQDMKGEGRRHMPLLLGQLKYGENGQYAYSPGGFNAQQFENTLNLIGAYNNG